MKVITQYQASDGSLHATEGDCKRHEATVPSRTVVINRENLDTAIQILNALIDQDRAAIGERPFPRDGIYAARNILVNGRHDRA